MPRRSSMAAGVPSRALLLLSLLLVGACSGGGHRATAARQVQTGAGGATSTSAAASAAGGAAAGQGPKATAAPTTAGSVTTASTATASKASASSPQVGAAPGHYTYDVSGSRSGGTPPTTAPINGKATLTVDPAQGTDQHEKLVSDAGSAHRTALP